MSCRKKRVKLLSIRNDQITKWTFPKGRLSILYYFQCTLTVFLMVLMQIQSSFVIVFCCFFDLVNLFNGYLYKIDEWKLKWKASFDPNPTSKINGSFAIAKFQREIIQTLCLMITQLILLPRQKIPQFHLISWCSNFVERHSFRIVSGKLPETMWELCLSTKFPHQEFRWNYGIKLMNWFLSHRDLRHERIKSVLSKSA